MSGESSSSVKTEDSLANEIKNLLSELKLFVRKDSDGKLVSLVGSLCDRLELYVADMTSTTTGESISILEQLLEWPDSVVKSKVAAIVASLAKRSEFREKCVSSGMVCMLCKMLEKCSDIDRNVDAVGALTNCCRALGNLCYENAQNRKKVTENGGLRLLMDTVKFSVNFPTQSSTFQEASVGLLLNFLLDEEELHPVAFEMNIVGLLTDVIESALRSHEESCTSRSLSLLISMSTFEKEVILNEKLCQVLALCLEEYEKSPEIGEFCIELMYNQVRFETVQWNITSSDLLKVLVDLLEKHQDMCYLEEFHSTFKMACDVIIMVLNDDRSMIHLYKDGRGPVFEKLVGWMSHSNELLLITGVMAIGNFARNDDHCIQMVENNIGDKLLILLKENNNMSDDMKLQHSVLSALRNLMIVPQNKMKLIERGLLTVVYPLLEVESTSVVFKLLSILRFAVDGQEQVAKEMGLKDNLVKKLVAWCDASHPGVQGEASRLIAWIIKNSKNSEVMSCMIKHNAVPHIVRMMMSPHAVMQNEALVALNLLAAVKLVDTEKSLLDADITKQLNTLLSLHPEAAVLHNMLTLLNQLCSSGILKNNLRQNISCLLKAEVARWADKPDISREFERFNQLVEAK